jgi:hypothetical protein
MDKKNYIPRKDVKFLEWVNTLFGYLVANATKFGLNPSLWAPIDVMIAAFNEAFMKAEAPNHGHADIVLKNECRVVLEKSVRQFVKEYLEYNHLVTDEDRILMGLPVHDTQPTPAPVAKTTPKAEIKLPLPAVIECHFQDSESSSKARPPGQRGAEFAYGILETRPVDWGELNHSTFATKSPFRISFNGADRGKTLYFAMRWENTRGEKGPWSEIQSTLIP